MWPKMGSQLNGSERRHRHGEPGELSAISIEIVDGRPHFKAFGVDGAAKCR